MDFYRNLASRVLSTPADDVTPDQRAQAKQVFWETPKAIGDLPGNHALQAVLKEGDGLRFADFDWPSRWNGATAAVAALSQSGAEVMATGFFGVLRFRLDRPDDVAAIVNHARRFADMVESAGRSYRGACDRCGADEAPRWTTEICRTCDPVRLCQECFAVHAAEAAADRAEGLGG